MSKVKLLVFILAAAVCLSASPMVPAQARRSGALYRRPVELRLQATARRTFRNFQGTNGRWPAIYTENFYPIGWSKNGNFAYYAEPVDEACGCYFAKLFILDLKTDKVLWKFEHQGDSMEEDRKAGKPYSFATLWRANQKLFSDKLREHGIEPQWRTALLAFPATHQGDRLTAAFKAEERAGLDEDARLYGEIGHLDLKLNSRRSGSKTVLDYTYKQGDALPLDVGLLGYIKSPYEPRIAVVLMEIYRGWEGPPHTGTVMIAGAHLETGFR
jgi:hypothetical protein